MYTYVYIYINCKGENVIPVLSLDNNKIGDGNVG